MEGVACEDIAGPDAQLEQVQRSLALGCRQLFVRHAFALFRHKVPVQALFIVEGEDQLRFLVRTHCV
jgi:hypothetical protein